jgi:AraC-like DNA-binding protein
MPTLAQGLRLELVEDRDPPALTWSIAPVATPAAQFLRFVPAYLVRMLQAHRGRQWRPLRILYSTPAPERPDLYAARLGCRLVFGAPIDAIEFRRADLQQEKTAVDTHLYKLLNAYAELLLGGEPDSDDLLECARAATRDGFALGNADLDFVARRLRLSTRSLQRKIARRGLSFRAMRDDVRFTLAQELLRRRDLSIGDIAMRLGYAEIAPFSRAFAKRFGASPRAVRRARLPR